MAELIALDLTDAEPVSLQLEDSDAVELAFTEPVVALEIVGDSPTEAVALDIIDAQPVMLSLDDPDVLSLTLTETVVALEVVGEIGPRGPVGGQGIQGIQGVQGIQGEQGIEGPAGTDTGYYRHVQATPSDAWFVQHDLGYNPAITVQDSAGSVVFGDPQYIDANSLIILFASAFSGFANLS
jgi:hypothetical protein